MKPLFLSMPGFGEMFLILIVIFIIFRKPILRFILRSLLNKVQRSVNARQQQYNQQQEPYRRDGSTFVSQKEKKSSNINKKNNEEYIDYEEIK